MTKTKYGLFGRLVMVTMALAILTPLIANAANITSGSLSLGDPRPSQTTTYTLSGSGFTASSIKCIQVKLNTAADGTGSVPTGMTTTSSTLSSATLITAGSWTVGNGTNGTLKATIAAGATPASSGNVVWAGVISGSTADTTYYGIVSTYTDTACSTGLTDTTTVAYLYKNGALVTMSVDPTLTFNITGVASGQTVNGATTNITTTATAIDYGHTVTPSVKGTSAQDLQVITNANGGFTVYLRQTGGFTNGTSTIAAWTGTNITPSAFPAAGTEAWGYSTADTSLAGGTGTRFTTPGNFWAGMPLTNDLVMDATTGGSQTTRVGQQLGIAATTPAGNYSTTLVYTAAGLY